MKKVFSKKILFLTFLLAGLLSGSPAPAQTLQTKQNQSASGPRAIDTTSYDKEIETANLLVKDSPQKKSHKKKLADAYAARGFALVEAAQYKAALGDFRRCLKLDPKNEEAKKMHDQILDVFDALDREPPKEGEEPPPLPFVKN